MWIVIASPLLKLFMSPSNPQNIQEYNQPIQKIQESANTVHIQEDNKSTPIIDDKVNNETIPILNDTINKEDDKPKIQEIIEDSKYEKFKDNEYLIKNTYNEKHKFGELEVDPIYNEKFWNSSDFRLIEIKHGSGIGETKKSIFNGIFGYRRVSKYDGSWTAKNGSGIFTFEINKPILLDGITFSTKSNQFSKIDVGVISDSNRVFHLSNIDMKENLTFTFEKRFISKNLELKLKCSDCSGLDQPPIHMTQFYLLPYDYR